MNDIQIMTLALSIVVPVALSISALIYSNSRVSDGNRNLEASVQATKEILRAEMATFRSEIMAALGKIGTDVLALDETIETRMKIHEMEHHR